VTSLSLVHAQRVGRHRTVELADEEDERHAHGKRRHRDEGIALRHHHQDADEGHAGSDGRHQPRVEDRLGRIAVPRHPIERVAHGRGVVKGHGQPLDVVE
jgi:hypothetical protein